ncbi:MAG: hypothetical protein AAFR61_01700 [Bacteroidota bacterium]
MRYFAIIGCLLLGANCSGPIGPFAHLTENERLEMAQGYFDRYQSDDFRRLTPGAMMLLDTALMLDSSLAAAWFEQATYAAFRGNYVGYFYAIEQAIEADEDYLGWRGWGRLIYLGDAERALEDFFQVKNVYGLDTPHPGGKNYFYWVGLCHFKLGKYQRAADAFEQGIIDIRTRQGEKWVEGSLYVYWGASLWREEKLKEAERVLGIALEKYAKDEKAHYYLGKVYLEEKKCRQARFHLREARTYFAKRYGHLETAGGALDEIYGADILAALQESCP